jgi:hypothetical protein
MKIVMMAAVAALLAAPAMAQDGAAENLVLPGATPAPDCGNLYGLAGRRSASARRWRGSALADAYIADLQTKGWLPAGGEDNRVVFVRRRDTGGCDGLQMQAFYDTSRPAGPTPSAISASARSPAMSARTSRPLPTPAPAQ